MRIVRSRAVGMALVAVAVVAAACSAPEGETIVVSSANFTESNLVAEIYAQALEAEGLDVERNLNLGPREVTIGALSSGEITVMPEYLAAFTVALGGEPTSDIEGTAAALRQLANGEGISVLEPASAQDSDGLGVTQATADEYGLTTISDLEAVAGDLVFGGPPECPERPFCLPGYEEIYGLEFASFEALDAGGPLTRAALANGEIDVAQIFTTLGWIEADGIVVLEDDAGLHPPQNLVPVVNTEFLTGQGGPDGDKAAVLNAVSAVLTTEDLIALNRAVDLEGESIEDAAARWLEDNGLGS